MCSFVYGYALSPPILGCHFELPKKRPSKQNLIFDKDYKKVTDVSLFTFFDFVEF